MLSLQSQYEEGSTAFATMLSQAHLTTEIFFASEGQNRTVAAFLSEQLRVLAPEVSFPSGVRGVRRGGTKGYEGVTREVQGGYEGGTRGVRGGYEGYKGVRTGC